MKKPPVYISRHEGRKVVIFNQKERLVLGRNFKRQAAPTVYGTNGTTNILTTALIIQDDFAVVNVII